jgi:hypothetical protein
VSSPPPPGIPLSSGKRQRTFDFPSDGAQRGRVERRTGERRKKRGSTVSKSMAPPAWVVSPGLMGQGLPRRSHDPDLGRGAVACGPWQPMPGPVWTMAQGRRHRNGRPGALASSRMSGSSQPSSRRPGPRRVLTPDFRVALTFLGLGIFMNYVVRNSFAGFVASTLGIFLVVQTSRLRFRFSSDRWSSSSPRPHRCYSTWRENAPFPF